jgi:threonine synthase
LPVEKLVVATNENDILHRFFSTGTYEKHAKSQPSDATLGLKQDGATAHVAGVRETLSPAMDILVSSNFERLLYIQLLNQAEGTLETKRQVAARQVESWLADLKTKGGFSVSQELLDACKKDFTSERVSDPETLATIKTFHSGSSTHGSYILDPHSAIGIEASLRSIAKSGGPQQTHTISLATAHPAKFAGAVKLALQGVEGFDFEATVLPQEFVGLEQKERKIRVVGKDAGIAGMREIIREEVAREEQW